MTAGEAAGWAGLIIAGLQLLGLVFTAGMWYSKMKGLSEQVEQLSADSRAIRSDVADARVSLARVEVQAGIDRKFKSKERWEPNE